MPKVTIELEAQNFDRFAEQYYDTPEEALQGFLVASQVLAVKDLKKPYKQGFNPETGDIVVVCSPEDVQQALALDYADQSTINEATLHKVTVSREKAIELMKANEEALTYAYHHGWHGEWEQSIQDVLGDQVSEADLTEKLED